MNDHVRELELRRHLAGEAVGPGIAEHLAACERCRERKARIEEEARAFAAAVPFEKFERGVMDRYEARKTTPLTPALSRRERGFRSGPFLGLLAALVVAVAAPALVWPHPHKNRLKGGAEIELRIAGPDGGPQRIAAIESPEALGRGERVRIGYRPGAHRFVAALSVDAKGEVTPLYPEAGQSLPAGDAAAVHYLPGSLEFTGKGEERVIVVLSDAPLKVAALEAAARVAYAKAQGNVQHLPELAVAGEQFQRTLLKP